MPYVTNACISFLLATLLILAGVSASAATCPVAQFDAQTAQVSLPCVKLGAQTLRMELGYRPQTPAAGHRWLLQDAGPIGAHRYTHLDTCHSGRDCRNPGCTDSLRRPSMALDARVLWA